MEAPKRHIHLRPRLTAAAELLAEQLPQQACVADIGCDHGRLSCGLLQQHAGWRCIAADVSAPSLEKARQLAQFTGLSNRVDVRCGNGLSVLQEGEADAVVLCGMGGELIVELLEAAPFCVNTLSLAVFQPMRGVEELRCWLYERGWHIISDRVVRDAGRLYQVFSARPPKVGEDRQRIPLGFPQECFHLGYKAFETHDALFFELVDLQMQQLMHRLKTAQGTRGEAELLARKQQLDMILSFYGKGRNETCS